MMTGCTTLGSLHFTFALRWDVLIVVSDAETGEADADAELNRLMSKGVVEWSNASNVVVVVLPPCWSGAWSVRGERTAGLRWVV